MHGTINRFYCDAPRQGDPTGTFTLRRKWKMAFGRSWQSLQGNVRLAVAQSDMLGLGSFSTSSLAFHAVGSLSGMTNGVKIKAFQSFLDDKLKNVVLQNDGSFLDQMVRSAYMMGIKRALRLAKIKQVPFDLQHRMEHNIDALTQLATVELQGIMEAVSQASVRVIAEGLLRRQKPGPIARAVNERIDKIGKTRSAAMVDVMVVRAFGEATLDLFEAASIRQVGLIPETHSVQHLRHDEAFDDEFDDAKKKGAGSRISRRQQPSQSTIYRIRRQEQKLEKLKRVRIMTAGDNRVCYICEGLETGGPYTINRARTLIPAHPRCRCAFIPA